MNIQKNKYEKIAEITTTNYPAVPFAEEASFVKGFKGVKVVFHWKSIVLCIE